MPLVLAIEPDHRQSTVLKRIVREHVHADLLLVDSPDAAVAALATQIPDLILVSALLAPQDEEDLFQRVHSLDGGGHIQTYTIPQFASSKNDEATEASGGFFGKFRRKRASTGVNSGCDPDLFAQEIATFVAKALELKTQNLTSPSKNLRLTARETRHEEPAATPAAQDADGTEPEASSWSSPFEWRKSDASASSKPKKKKKTPAAEPAKPSFSSVEDLQASIRANEERNAKAAERSRAPGSSRNRCPRRSRASASRRRGTQAARGRGRRQEEARRGRAQAPRGREPLPGRSARRKSASG